MDGAHLDRLSRLLARPSTRRATIGVAAAFGLDPLLTGAGRKKKSPCKGGCGPCRECQKQGSKKRCVDAPKGTTCAGGGTCRAGACCVPTTCASLGVTCGPAPDGCGGTLKCGTCGVGATPACNAGTCATCAATCGAGCAICYHRPDGSTVCGNPKSSTCPSTCTTDADCPGSAPLCVAAFSGRATGNTQMASTACGVPATGICFPFSPC